MTEGIDYVTRHLNAEDGVLRIEVHLPDYEEDESPCAPLCFAVAARVALQCLKAIGRVKRFDPASLDVTVSEATYAAFPNGTMEKRIDVKQVSVERFFQDYIKDVDLFELILHMNLRSKMMN